MEKQKKINYMNGKNWYTYGIYFKLINFNLGRNEDSLE
jgi:hypothetical protein